MAAVAQHLWLSAIINAAAVDLPPQFEDIAAVLLAGGYLALEGLHNGDCQHCACSIAGRLPEVVQFINGHMQQGDNVLVHYKGGTSRSVALIAAYPVDKQKMG